MRTILMILMALAASPLRAQVTDDFSDGDFTSDPAWFGDVSNYKVENGMLNSDGPRATSSIYLSTESEVVNAEWQFSVQLGFSPSGSNKFRVYLISDQADLKTGLNGYFIEVGQSGADKIKLYRQDGASEVLLFTGSSEFSDDFEARIKITREVNGLWTVYSDPSGGNNFMSEGDSFQDDNHYTTSYFGLVSFHTSTRNTLFFYDDFLVSEIETVDEDPPKFTSAKAVSDSLVVVTFTEPLDSVSAEVPSNYMIDRNVTVRDATLSSPNTVTLSTSLLENGEDFLLRVSNVQDSAGNTIEPDAQISFTYLEVSVPSFREVVINEVYANQGARSPYSKDYLELFNATEDRFFNLQGWTIEDNNAAPVPLDSFILKPRHHVLLTTDTTEFEAMLSTLETRLPNFNNANDHVVLKGLNAQIIDSVSYEQTREGASIEQKNPFFPCFSPSNYGISQHDRGGTPGAQNSLFDETPDSVPPEVASYGFTGSLTLHFNEPMDPQTLVNSSNYMLSELTISETFVGRSPSTVELFFVEETIPGVPYQVEVAGLKDCSGNEMEPARISFGLGRPPTFNELIISEIMYDEDPAVGLPEREYLELLNATDKILSTAGISLKDATSTVDLPSVNLDPHSYIVLTSTAGAAEFEGNAIGVGKFPSLNNAGELLVLSRQNELIHSIDYDPNWHEKEKSSGGYSLELVDISNPCLESPANWRSSADPSGGTPGRRNSIIETNPDHFGPEIEQVLALSSDTLRIDFSEKIDPLSVMRTVLLLEPAVEIDSVYMVGDRPKSLFVTLADELEANQLYAVLVGKSIDCAGNEIQESESTFALPILATKGEIKLSEVLFNPRRDGVDFVEIFNDSESYINLQHWRLARITDEGITDEKGLSSEPLVLRPGDYLALTSDANTLLTHYPKSHQERFLELPMLPTFSNDTGNVVLLDQDRQVVESFFYDQDFHSSLLESVDGVSLERISFNDPVDNSGNWRSAASTEGFATPGYANSQAKSPEASSMSLQIEPKVFIPGNSGSGRDFTMIHYQLGRPGQFANVTIYDHNGRRVKTLAQGALLASKGFLRWDGEKDDGAMARLGYYLVLFEIYDANGGSEMLKETVVVGRNF